MKKGTTYLTKLALLTGILIVLSVTPIGSIPLPFVKATTSHISVIIGAILLGVSAGAFLGFVFGVMSVIRSTLFPTVTSFVFSPFLPLPGSENGSIKALAVALVPRVLVGVVSTVLYDFLSRKNRNRKLTYAVSAAAGSLTNTALVLVLIYLLFGREYAAASDISYEALVGVLMTVVLTNGIGELCLAVVVTVAVCTALSKCKK